MTQKIVPVIMAGGKGTRLWPLSRSTAPKQFIDFLGDKTLFQETLERVSDQEVYHPPIILTNDGFRFLAAQHAKDVAVGLSAIVLEPFGRNTAGALAVAATIVEQMFGADALIQVMGSDYELEANQNYRDSVAIAAREAGNGNIAILGIQPTEPSTGFGYIQAGDATASGVNRVKRFVEKPAREQAEQMLAAGGYYWNSGMFVTSVGTLQAELNLYATDVIQAAEGAVRESSRDLDFIRLSPEEFQKIPDISIDYAVMEKTKRAVVVPSHFPWSDLGSWDAVKKSGACDAEGNVTGDNTTVYETTNSLILSRGPHIAVHGLDGITVIASEDAVYVGSLSQSQDIGKLVKKLASSPVTSKFTEIHPTSYRPWGGYTSVLQGERFQVKRIFVSPGKKLSLQKHHHRSEHWIVVKGTAEVTIGENVSTLRENESVYIPLGEVHRLYNPGKIMLELIEVQTGSYLGEDDIIRITDEFGRA